jgi:D-alanine-D-alanine ligase
LLRHGIPTAPYQILYTGLELVTVPLPAIVKPLSEDCSLGINQNSVVCDVAALRKQVAYILRVYRQPALVEMFLDGREFSVSVWGNGVAHVLPIGEVDFSNCPDGRWLVDDFEAKWSNRFAAIYPALVDSGLVTSIRQIALAAYKTMGCRDYARVDMREKDGRLYVLEVNPNPCLSTSGGFARAARAAGYDYAKMVRQLAQWAWYRKGKEEANHS